ncbi:hypothetical protein PQX77_014723 [Marasmius sp. AFHP31]|nr:hypothetical protein PQX77_014723 [Marasmius sp. AFHP31]
MEQTHEFQAKISQGQLKAKVSLSAFRLVPTIVFDLPISNLSKFLVAAEQASGGGGNAGSNSADKYLNLPHVHRQAASTALSTSDNIIEAQVAALVNAEANLGGTQAQPSNSIGRQNTRTSNDSYEAERLFIAGTIASNAVDEWTTLARLHRHVASFWVFTTDANLPTRWPQFSRTLPASAVR